MAIFRIVRAGSGTEKRHSAKIDLCEERLGKIRDMVRIGHLQR